MKYQILLLFLSSIYFCVHAGDRGDVMIPENWSVSTGEGSPMPSDDYWWKDFNDQLLDSLIAMAESNNFNLAAARKRIAISRNQIQQLKAGYWPGISISANYNYTKDSGRESVSYSSPAADSYYGLQGDLSWEIDLFGRISSQLKAGKYNVEGSRAEYSSAMVSLCAELATDYFSLITCKERLKVAHQNLGHQEEIVRMTEARYEAGLVSALDVSQAKSVVYSTQSTIPVLEAQVDNLRRSIATLCGVYRENLPNRVSADTLPDCPAVRDLGIPADLLRRRPDILAAESRLGELATQIGISRKDFLPTLSLNGSFALHSHNLKDMFHHDAATFEVTPTLSWTLFDGLSRNYKLAAARLSFEEEIDNYNLTLMTAVEEVNSAIALYNAYTEQIEVIAKVVEQNKETLRLSLERYILGLSDFSNVVNAQVALIGNQNSLTISKGNRLAALVTLYKALGGGWSYR